MGVVGLVEQQKVAQQWRLRPGRRRCLIMTRMAEDHRRLKLGQRIGGMRGVGGGQGGAQGEPARQGKTHERQQQQAQQGTLDQG